MKSSLLLTLYTHVILFWIQQNDSDISAQAEEIFFLILWSFLILWALSYEDQLSTDDEWDEFDDNIFDVAVQSVSWKSPVVWVLCMMLSKQDLHLSVMSRISSWKMKPSKSLYERMMLIFAVQNSDDHHTDKWKMKTSLYY